MTKGGKRQGAGRPIGSGKYGGPTKTVRIPYDMVDDVMRYVGFKGYSLPLYSCNVSAGFPTPADDSIEMNLDLNDHLIKHPAATFLVRATGDSMINAGIHEGDIMVVDRSLEAKSGKVVIAAVDGMLTVKRLLMQDGKTLLIPENPKYQPIEINEGEGITIWGVVKFVIHGVS